MQADKPMQAITVMLEKHGGACRLLHGFKVAFYDALAANEPAVQAMTRPQFSAAGCTATESYGDRRTEGFGLHVILLHSRAGSG